MYNGGKNSDGMYHTIINWFPPHDNYIECFLGSGAIIKRKKPAKELNLGIEINKKVITQYHSNAPYEVGRADAIHFLSEFARRNVHGVGTLIYLDPPYPIGARRSSNKLYDYELTDKDHERLLKILISLPCMIAISTYKNPLYTAMLKDWNFHDFNAGTHAGKAIERLYMNYPKPKKLHEYNFLGKDFIDRQRIKRKIRGKILQLIKLPPLERAAIIEAIAAGID